MKTAPPAVLADFDLGQTVGLQVWFEILRSRETPPARNEIRYGEWSARRTSAMRDLSEQMGGLFMARPGHSMLVQVDELEPELIRGGLVRYGFRATIRKGKD